MSDKPTKSRLFQAPPNELLLDERVSKIVLPTFAASRPVMDEREANWGLKNDQEDEFKQTEKLQIFVGTSGTSNTSSWEIPDEEEDDPFDDLDFEDDIPTPMILNLGSLEAGS